MEICKAGAADMIQVASIYRLREYVNNKNNPVFNYKMNNYIKVELIEVEAVQVLKKVLPLYINLTSTFCITMKNITFKKETHLKLISAIKPNIHAISTKTYNPLNSLS